MQAGIHPKYIVCKVSCICGNAFETRASVPELKVEICSSCHPFFTGKQRYVDSAGRVEKFQRKFSAETTKERMDLDAEQKKKRVKKEKVVVGAPRIKRRAIEEEAPPARGERGQRGGGRPGPGGTAGGGSQGGGAQGAGAPGAGAQGASSHGAAASPRPAPPPPEPKKDATHAVRRAPKPGN
jgi:large subunit ribosomal protein L31